MTFIILLVNSTMRIDELFSKTIAADFQLAREHRKWTIKGNTDIAIQVPCSKSFGFCLDARGNKPFPFFGNPPEHVAKMCDGIIVLSYKNKDHIFVIELKTTDKGPYKKQLKNGQYVCEWLLTLLKEHGHYPNKKQVHFIGLLCYEPRRITNKGTTSHRKSIAPSGEDNGLPIYEFANQQRVVLSNIIK